jgi:hypothetical protein
MNNNTNSARSTRTTRTGRIAKALAVVVIAGVAASAAPQAQAALPKCNAVRRGQIVGRQVCSVKNGTYRWVKVVAPAPAPAPAASSGLALPASDAAPAGFTRVTASDNSWSVLVPSTWTFTDINGSGTVKVPGRNKLFFSPGNTSSSFSFYIGTTVKPSKDPTAELADWVKSTNRTVLEQKLLSLNGLPMISMTDNQASDANRKMRQILVFRNTDTDGESGAIKITAQWYEGMEVTAERKAELNAILASVTVTP